MRYVGRHRAPRPLLLRRPVVGGTVAAVLLAVPVLYVSGNFSGAIRGGTPSEQIAEGTKRNPTTGGGPTGLAETVIPTDGSALPNSVPKGISPTGLPGNGGGRLNNGNGAGVNNGAGNGNGAGSQTTARPPVKTTKPGTKPIATTKPPVQPTTPKPPAPPPPTTPKPPDPPPPSSPKEPDPPDPPPSSTTKPPDPPTDPTPSPPPPVSQASESAKATGTALGRVF